jgi:hypothetical protein
LQEYEDLVKYLLMVRKKVKEPKVDSELIYAYAKTGQLGEIEEFIATPNAANLQNVGDKCFDEGLYEAAKILFTHISNWQRLASTLIKLKQFQVRDGKQAAIVVEALREAPVRQILTSSVAIFFVLPNTMKA